MPIAAVVVVAVVGWLALNLISVTRRRAKFVYADWDSMTPKQRSEGVAGAAWHRFSTLCTLLTFAHTHTQVYLCIYISYFFRSTLKYEQNIAMWHRLQWLVCRNSSSSSERRLLEGNRSAKCRQRKHSTLAPMAATKYICTSTHTHAHAHSHTRR